MNVIYLKQMGTAVACYVLFQAGAWADNVTATAEIRFKGSSTLHDFEGMVSASPFVAVIGKDPETGKASVSGRTSLQVRHMTTSNNKRDKNMFKMLDAAHFQLIEGELKPTLIAAGETVTARLCLKICTTEKEVSATLSNFQRQANRISCNVSFPVSLKDFGLKPPSVIGLIRIDNTVQIECTVAGTITDSTTLEN